MLWVNIKLHTSDDYTDTGKHSVLAGRPSPTLYPPPPRPAAPAAS